VRAPGRLGERPGALCCRSGFPPIPAETARHYSESLAVDCAVPATASIYSRSEVEAFLGTGPPPLTTKHPLMRRQVPVANLRIAQRSLYFDKAASSLYGE